MNIKQKCIEAMAAAGRRWLDGNGNCTLDLYVLDAILAVLADPENWANYKYDLKIRDMCAVINHVRKQKG